MPFMKEYECTNGHVFEHLHMGSRDTLPPQVPCPVEGLAADNSLKVCGADAKPVFTPVRVSVLNPRNSDYPARERERLEKRSNDHWEREGKDEAIAREKKALGFSPLAGDKI